MTFINTLIEYFVQGGFWMWLILAFTILAVAIIVERTVELFNRRKIGEIAYSKTFEQDICRGQLSAVIDRARNDRKSHPLAAVVEAGAQAAVNFGGKDEIQGKMDEILLQENHQIEARTGYLSMLANVGTLTGLLGTIAGMIQSFAAVANATPAEKATLLAGGISVAMNTTAFGLIMAIPSLLFYAWLTNRSNALKEDLNQAALKVFNYLSFAYENVVSQNTRQVMTQKTYPNNEVTA